MVQISKRTPKCPETNKWMSKNVVSIRQWNIFCCCSVCQASLSFTISWILLKLMSIESMMPSNHFILCHPLLLLPSIFPSMLFASGGHCSTLKRKDFLGGPVVKKLPANAGDTGSIPPPGRYHMPDTRYHGATKPKHPKNLCSTTRSHHNEKPVCM